MQSRGKRKVECVSDLLQLQLQRCVRLVQRRVVRVVVVLACGSQLTLANKQPELVFDFKAVSPLPQHDLLRLAEVQPVYHVAASKS